MVAIWDLIDTAIVLDMAVVAAIWVVAQWLFRGFEAHVPWPKRLLKFGLLFALLLLVRMVGGRIALAIALGALTAGIGVLHGYWFHVRHGVHWRKAEPREKYLQLIGQKGEGR